MGVLARILGFVWKRWADYQSVVAILDVLDLKTAVSGGLAVVAMMFFGATNMSWSAPAVMLAALAAGALVSIIMVAVRLFWRLGMKETKETRAADVATSNEFAGDIPDVRVADDVIVLALFSETRERDKLIPLLEGGKINAWGRLGNGYPPPMKIPADLWRTSYLDHHPATPNQFISQTFLRPKARPYESTYYDVYLNRAQLERGWPRLWAQNEKWPDFKIWDQKEKFELYEAACLWFNIDPVLPMPELARAKYQTWKDMVFGGGLPIDVKSTLQIVQIGKKKESAVTPHDLIDRGVLETLAEHEGHQPLFLYPHKRGEK